MSSRREARERVMQALYAFELGGGDAPHILDTLIRPKLTKDAAVRTFAERLFLRTLDYAEEADKLISQHADNWDLTRIALIDRVLLRMALSEFSRFEDIPPKVTINEAIDIAKRYSTNKSGKFINGILDATLLDLQKQGRLNKSGRGLIGMPSIQNRLPS
ncbi:MAG: transcription antitermination factor NusB [Rhodothermales bacterium]